MLTVQDDISRQIAITLSRTFGAAPTAKSPSLATTNADVYDAYLLGLWHLKARSSNTPGDSARTRLVAAIEELNGPSLMIRTSRWRAPCSPALTRSSFSTMTRSRTWNRRPFWRSRGRLRSTRIRPRRILRVRNSHGTCATDFPTRAPLPTFGAPCRSIPTWPTRTSELGKVYLHVGQTDKAVEANDQGQQLDPSAVPPASRKVTALVDAGRLDEVRHELDRHSRLTPISHGDALLRYRATRGGCADARARSVNGERGLESVISAAALLAVVYARLGRREEAERVVDGAIPMAENLVGFSHVHHAQFYIGSALSVLGRHDEAVRWLTKAAAEGYASYPRFSTDQSLAPLKAHTGFTALLARLREDRDRWRKTL